MPDTLYDQDILLWSEQQASLLRRVANGERVNGVDWPNIAEEIEDVGSGILNSVRGLLLQALVHLLKSHALPTDPARGHWALEIGTFLDDAELRFVPSMRQRIDLEVLFRKARKRVLGLAPSAAFPEQCPWTIGDLLAADIDSLIAVLISASDTALSSFPDPIGGSDVPEGRRRAASGPPIESADDEERRRVAPK